MDTKINRRITAASRTHTGMERDRNEDSIMADEALGLFIVADGMGGHRFGAHASRMAVDHIRRHLMENAPPPGADEPAVTPEQAKQMLGDAFFTAHTAIIEFARQHAGGHIIGTTCTSLWLQNQFAVAGHIGDSALFRLGEDGLTQLTTEHTLVQEMVEIGRLTPEQAKGSPYANVLSKVLGLEAKYAPEIMDVEVTGESRFLICSDGLTKVVPVDELSPILAAIPADAVGQSLDQAADQLQNLALARGGPDNISLILIQCAPIGPQPGTDDR
jgi:PPM family protein phosphatase